ncbi:lysozyme [Waterburya agarophytonicola]|uniref:lysozyme n=1 Tax=Waterburya agarophytonicola TaxID=2886916 RepID=UPI001E45C7E0|nr:lysozyme [Waterburya agarophytonicola]
MSIDSSHASQLNQQNKQLKTDRTTANNIKHIIASNKVNPSNHKVLASTLSLIKQHEGFRAYAYIDTSGLPVIGYGQSRINGKKVRMGQYITQAQADATLEREIYHIQSLILANVRVELTPHQLGALTSLVYNAGMKLIKQSTLSRKLNAGDYQGAAREFPRWNKANQGGRLVALPGLTKRRIAEQNMFLTPYISISSQ